MTDANRIDSRVARKAILDMLPSGHTFSSRIRQAF